MALVAVCALLFAACSPDDYSLGDKNISKADLLEGTAFTVTEDASTPNLFHLQSLLPSGYTVLWDTPQGRSQQPQMDLSFPFPGTQYIRFGVETRGGVVYSDSVAINVKNTNLAFVSDDLWTYLSGGVGKSKTWVPNDYEYMDPATGKKFAAGELAYADPSTTVEFGNWAANWDPGKGITADDGIFTSSMTFGLDAQKGATVSIVNNTAGATQNTQGSFMLDADAKTLTFTNASILHTQSWDYKASNWGLKLKVLTLTENFLQVAIWRDTSGEGDWWMVLNFVSEDFKKNYVREAPTIKLPDNWQNAIQQNVVTTVKWTLSAKHPYNWALADGTLENEWATAADYPDWGQGTWDAARIGKFSMTLNSADHTATFTDLEGNTTEGTYQIGDDGWITFEGVTVPEFDITTGGGWSIAFKGEGGNQLRIVKIIYNNVGAVDGMWVGRWNKEGEYQVFYLEASSAATASDPLAAWSSALNGKTFTLDPVWFCDWTTGFDEATGWTEEKKFVAEDGSFINGWCYDASTQAVITTSRLSFKGTASNMTATLTYTKADGTKVNETGKVTIDNDNSTLTFPFKLVDLTGATGDWLGSDNAASGAYWSRKACAANEWIFAAHGKSNLATVGTEGFWLGRVSSAVAAGADKDELLLFHWVQVK